jgi:hypothetical protein
LRSQSCGFLLAELKHEVRWESRDVPLHLLDEATGFHSVQLSEVLIQHDVTFAHHQDALLNRRKGNQLEAVLLRSLRHVTIVAPRPDSVEIAFCDLKPDSSLRAMSADAAPIIRVARMRLPESSALVARAQFR